jgi:outer membrane lipoprotein-sorting protein
MTLLSLARRGLAGSLLLLAILAIGPARAALPPADDQLILRIGSYLNGITTLEAHFEQIAPNGSLSTGTVYIDRPGRLRFDYDPPSKVLLIAEDWRVIFYDGSIKQVNTIPLSQTPLAFLLADTIRLDKDVDITRVVHRPGEVDLTLIRDGDADQGSVTLTFGDSPIELRRWSVTDAQGLVTRIILSDIVRGQKLDPELFHWKDPQMFGYPKD